MIKEKFIKKQVEKSHYMKCTSLLAPPIADIVASAHYGNEYCLKCTQTSAAMQMLLARLGIKSRLTLVQFVFLKY